MAGVRLGYAVGSPALIDQIKKLQPIDHVSNFAVKIGEYILDHEDLVWNYAAETEQGKAYLKSELSQMGFHCISGQGNFVLADFAERKDDLVQKLRARDILVASNLRFPFRSGYVRITAGPTEQMRRFIAELKSLVTEKVSI